MYRVLLVDDEPLILSGIRHMIDWEANNCNIVGSAKNGSHAQKLIDSLYPDIVIADINMPVMTGIELLQKVCKDKPSIVFIMLTNLQDFDLVRESLRMHAVDYIVKTQMDKNILEDVLKVAKAESDKRKHISQISFVEDTNRISEKEILKNCIKQLILGHLQGDQSNIFGKFGILDGYCMINMWFISNSKEEMDDMRQKLSWSKDMINNVADNCFDKYVIVESNPNSIYLFFWGNKLQESIIKIKLFVEKMISVSINIFGIRPKIFVSDYLSGMDNMLKCVYQIKEIKKYFYLSGKNVIYYFDVPNISYRSLMLDGLSARLSSEINNRSVTSCKNLLQKAIDNINSIPHDRNQANWICNELYTVVSGVIKDSTVPESYFCDSVYAYDEIECLYTKGDVLFWLNKFSNELLSVLEPVSTRRISVLESVKGYVYENIDKRITLNDVANHACFSPSYISYLFKKEYNQGFIDFVNQVKMERACELIDENKYRIQEIAYLLGFENAYYFSKVFRRHKGVSPTQWQKSNFNR